MSSTDATSDQVTPEPPVAPWIQATEGDFDATDLEAPLSDQQLADSYDISERYLRATNSATEAGDATRSRVYSMLNGVSGMHFKPHEPMEPFGPMFVGPKGRSAIIDDFRGKPSDILFKNLTRMKNPMLRARVADVVWIIDRSRSNAASAAIEAYLDVLTQIDQGTRKSRFNETGAFGHDAVALLRRALSIGRQIGWDKDITQAARRFASDHRSLALSKNVLHEIREWSETDLDFGISAPAIVAQELEVAISRLGDHADFHQRNWLFKLAARGYHYAKKPDDAERCWIAAAECLVSLAESQTSSAMFSAHWLGIALSEYQKVKGHRDRKTALRHKLIDTQALITEQMSSFSHQTDIKEIAEDMQARLSGKSLLGMLKAFVLLAIPPDIKELREAAKQQIRQFPLSSLFATSHLDHEGKTIHRSPGAGGLSEPDEGSLENQIALNEKIRRGLAATSRIEVARETIIASHYVDEQDFLFICQNSPFIPDGHFGTYARGFVRFFQGDMIGAVYTLVPQLENSLRYVLKAHGHDVTKLNLSDLTQEDRTISGLFEQMRTELESIFGINTVADIERVFLLKSGPYLRHQVAHGLLLDGTPFSDDARYACWLIFHLVCIPLLRHWEQLEQAHNDIFGTP